MKLKFLIVTALALSFLVGCSGFGKSEGDSTVKQGSQGLQKVELKAYAAPKDWKIVSQEETPVATTDWIDLQTADNQKPVGYSISYPGEWKLEYSVFVDKDEQKFAELIPPIIMSQGQKPFDNWKPGYGEKLVSRKEIVLGDLNGQKLVTEITPDDGPVWYPHSYCLAKGDKAFMIIFYEEELGSGNEVLFDKIVSTLKFD